MFTSSPWQISPLSEISMNDALLPLGDCYDILGGLFDTAHPCQEQFGNLHHVRDHNHNTVHFARL